MRSVLRPALAVLLVAVGVRVAAALWLGVDGPAEGDERGYALLAESLARGDGLRLPLPPDVVAEAGRAVAPLRSFRTPGLPLALAPVALAGGGLAAMRVVCLALGALGAPLLFVAARPSVGVRAALLAAVAYALWPPAIHVSLRALAEPLCMALLLGAVAALRRTPWGAGCLAGLAVLTRPSVVLPAALLALCAGSWRRSLAVLGTVALVLVPWVTRTTYLHGRPLLSTNAGATLVGGNNDVAARATPPGKWHAPDAVYASRSDPPDLGIWGWSALGESASDARFTRDALDWITGHPGDALRLVGAKVVRLVDPDPHSARADASRKRLIGWLTLPPVLLLALVGAFARRRRLAEFGPWYALAVGTVATVVVFYGDTRMRAAADPTLLVLAACGVDALLPRSRTETATAGSG